MGKLFFYVPALLFTKIKIITDATTHSILVRLIGVPTHGELQKVYAQNKNVTMLVSLTESFKKDES